MARTAEEYASWIVANADKKGTPDFETVAQAYKLAKNTLEPQKPLVEQIPGGEGVSPVADPADTVSIWDKAKAVGDTALGTVWNMGAAIPAAIAGAGAQIASGRLGTQDTRAQDQAFSSVMDAIRHKPASELSEQYTNKTASTLNDLGINAIPGVTGITGISRIKPSIAPAARQVMSKVGSAVPTTAAITTPAKYAAAIMSTKNPASIERVYSDARNGITSTAENMRGQIPESQMLADAKQGIRNAQELNHAEYANAKTGWAADKTKLSFQPIDDAFNKLESSLEEGGHLKVGTPEINKINEVKDVLSEWRNDTSVHTTVGLDALKQRLDAIYPDSPMQNQAQRVIAGTSKAVRDAIVAQAPDYAEAMHGYASRLETIRDINKALSLGDKVSKDTAISRLKTLAKDDKHFRRAMAEQLKQEGGVDIMGAIAGQDLSSWMPNRIGKMNAFGVGSIAWALSHPIAAALMLPLTSPRAIGEIATGAGKLATKILGKPKQPRVSTLSTGESQPSFFAPKEGEVLPPAPDWIPGNNAEVPFTSSPNKTLANPFPNNVAGILGTQTPLERAMKGEAASNHISGLVSKNRDLAQALREQSAERKPTSGGQLYDLDPVTGKLVPVDKGLKGATPDTVVNTGNDLASAAEKVASGRQFAMTADEKIAWNKTKVNFQQAAPELKGLSDEAIAAKMVDRQWVSDTIKTARQAVEDKAAAEYASFAKQAADKYASRQQQARAIADYKESSTIQRMRDSLANLEELEPQARPEPKSGQGPKTREFNAEQLAKALRRTQ